MNTVKQDIELVKKYHDDLLTLLNVDTTIMFGNIKILNGKLLSHYFLKEENNITDNYNYQLKGAFNSKANFIYNIEEKESSGIKDNKKVYWIDDLIYYFNIFTKEEVIKTIINKGIILDSFINDNIIPAKSEEDYMFLEDLYNIYNSLNSLKNKNRYAMFGIEETEEAIKEAIFKRIDLREFKIELYKLSIEELLPGSDVIIINENTFLCKKESIIKNLMVHSF